MQSQSQASALDAGPLVAYILAGIVAATALSKLFTRPSLDAIPTVGSNSWLGPWWDGHNFAKNGQQLIQEGYEKYKGAPFKVMDRYRWTVVLSSREHMEELRKAPEEVLSFYEFISEMLQKRYTMGPELANNSYHVEIIRSHLTRSLADLYDHIRDEICVAFDEVLDLGDDEWKSIPALRAIQQVVCRTSNRLFVGLPLCRDPDWINLTLRYTMDILNGSDMIRRFPVFLAPLVAHFMTNAPRSVKHGIKHLGPIIEQRLKNLEEHGKDWAHKPNDGLSWLLDIAPEGPERTVRLLTTRVLAINFAAIHTTSNSFTHALYLLAENPQYIEPLREEVESIVEKEGWSKASLGKMCKIDSFLRESQRFVGISATSFLRMAVKDFTFSDGTFIPKGTAIAVPSLSLHLDDKNYHNARVFDPFRFTNMRDEDGDGGKHKFVSTSTNYLPFGYGKHACPGRFFVANELKTMLAHIVASYDVKLEETNARPKEMRVGMSIVPNPFAKVMFRKRVHQP